MKSALVILLAGALVVLSGCGMIAIPAGYTPTAEVQPVVKGNPKVALKVTDVREKKVFFRTALGDTPDGGKGALYRLERPLLQIFEEGFTQALQAAGCQVRGDADIVYAVGIKRFLAVDREDPGSLIKTDIVLDVQVVRSGDILAKKTVFETDEQKQGFFQAWQHILPELLSRSLSRAIESAVFDPELIAAIEIGTGLSTKVADVGAPLDAFQAKPKPTRLPVSGSLPHVGIRPDVTLPKPPPVHIPARKPGLFQPRYVAGLGKPEVVVTNQSGRSITLRLTGPEQETFTVAPHSSVKKTLPPGQYSYHASAIGVAPASGLQTFTTNYRYTWTFMIISMHSIP